MLILKCCQRVVCVIETDDGDGGNDEFDAVTCRYQNLQKGRLGHLVWATTDSAQYEGRHGKRAGDLAWTDETHSAVSGLAWGSAPGPDVITAMVRDV